jgi:hypothetical protein
VIALIADITDTAPAQTATTTDERVVATSTTVSTTSTTTEGEVVSAEPTPLPIPPGTVAAPAPQAPTPVKPAVISAPQSNAVVLPQLVSSSIVTVATARIAKPGYIVIYRTNSQERTELIGYSELLTPGYYTNVQIQVTSGVVKKQVVTAVLHEDDGDEKFEFPTSDFYLKNGGRLVYDEDVVDVPVADEAGLINGTIDARLQDAKSTYVPN